MFPAPASLGFLACAAVLGVQAAFDAGRLVLPGAPRGERLLAGITVVLGALVGCLQVLFHANWLNEAVLLGLGVAGALGVRLLRRRRFPEDRVRADWVLLGAGLSAFDAVLVAVLLLSVVAAYLLPVWQWDSLGYHLPFVNFVLQDGGRRGLPLDVPYLSTYPRNVELLFVVLRALLPDDRLVDLGQLPLGLVAAAATVWIARTLGAGARLARAAGVAFLALPAVFLQLPTNYIDVGVAAFFLLAVVFLLGEATTPRLLLAGLAIGLFLGTKPNTPPAALLLGLVLLVRAHRGARLSIGFVALGLAGLLGLEAYVVQLVRHGNPVWPAIVHVGPFELPGTISVSELLSSGAGAEKVSGPLPQRMLASWASFDARPVFDMRVGGLAYLFWGAVPFALRGFARPTAWLLLSFVAIALVTPDPAVVRYVLAMPALVLAVAASELERWLGRLDARVPAYSKVARRVLVGFGLLLGFQSLRYATPGLVGEGPPLLDYWSLSWDQRAVAVGANGRPTDFVEATNELAPGDVAVYDRALFLPYLMWRADFSNRVARAPDHATRAELDGLLAHPHVKLVAAESDSALLAAVRRDPTFRERFPCPEDCIVFMRP